MEEIVTFIFIDILERKKNVLELLRGPKREPIEPCFKSLAEGVIKI